MSIRSSPRYILLLEAQRTVCHEAVSKLLTVGA